MDVDEVAVARSNKRGAVDIVKTCMVKKPAVAGRSRPALLLLLRIRSPIPASASSRVLQYEWTITMMIQRSLAPAVGPLTPNQAGRAAGGAAARSRSWRGAAA